MSKLGWQWEVFYDNQLVFISSVMCSLIILIALEIIILKMQMCPVNVTHDEIWESKMTSHTPWDCGKVHA